MNSAAEQFLGWTIADANQAGFNGFTDPTLVENGTISSFKKAIAGETVIEPPMSFEPRPTIGQGQWKWAQGHYYPIRDAAGQVQEIIEVALDLTAMYEIQQKLNRERNSLLKATAQVANLLLRASDYTTVLPDVVKLLGEAVGSDRCGVIQSTIEPNSGKPLYKVLVESNRDEVQDSLSITPELQPGLLIEDNLLEIHQRFLQGEVINTLTEELPEAWRRLYEAQGNTSALGVPIFSQGILWGHISFDNCGEPRLYDEAEIAILQVAAESLAAAIERQAKERELRESEYRYRTLFELSSEGIMRFGYEQPIPLSLSVDEQLKLCYESIYIADANDAYAEMYAYEKAEDLIGLTLNDLHERDSTVTQSTMRAWIENQYCCRQLETVEFDRYGRHRYFLNSSVSTTEDDCVTSTWVSQIDITELREAQQALLKAEQERSQELENLNAELQQTFACLENRDRILEATTAATNVLLTADNLDTAVNAALQIIGESLDTDRVAVIENFDCPSDSFFPCWQGLYEWVSPGTMPQITHPSAAQGSYAEIEWLYELFQNGHSASYQIEEAPEPFRSEQIAVGTISTNIVPVYVEGNWWGVLGIDDCRKATHRTPSELSVLKTAAACVGSAIQRDRTQKAIFQAEQERSQELEKVNEELRQRDRLLSVVSQVTKDLLETEDVDSAILSALQAIGEVGKMSRVLLILEHQDPSTHDLTHRVTHEWTAAGVCDHKSAHMAVMENRNFQVLTQALYQGQSIWQVIEDLPEVTRSQFKKLNVQSTGVVPIFIERSYVGCVGFDDCVTSRQWSTHEIDILTFGAGAIGAALCRKQLIERLIEERTRTTQQQAAELAKANDALKQTVDILATEANLERFLGHVLKVLAAQLDAPLTEYWYYSKPGNDAYLGLTYWQGKILKPDEQPGHPGLFGYPVPPEMIHQENIHHRRSHFIIEDLTTSAIYIQIANEYGLDVGTWYKARGVKYQLNVPLILGNKTIGTLLVFLPGDRHFTKQQIELSCALAQQVTLATQLSHLAEEAKQSAIFEERNRLAGEIHDTLAQTFTGISVQLELAQYLSQHNPTEVSSILDYIGSLAQTGLTEARRSVWSIYPASEDYADLRQKLIDCVEHLTLGTTMHTQVNINGDSYPLSCFLSKNLLRITQESITNTLKHTQATELRVELTYTSNQVSLCVNDNGCGFCPQSHSEGFGLIGISERADRIGGQLRITTQPGQGTEIFVQVPL